ncbi:acyl-CoA dehydrogenase family protein [Corynebacterium sp. H128]|uniref:acyl-CoA dehydrogenase family protein n=1 Tax=unclassified Corynebacterium TaxID=2624378 RepID=UPI00309D8C81
MAHELLDPATDFYALFSDVSGADLDFWKRARTFSEEAQPEVNDAWEKAEYPLHLIKRLGELGLVNDGLDVPGREKMSPLAAGLVLMEVARCDVSLCTFLAIQAGLVMRSIAYCASEEQKDEWLPALADVDKLASFGLTEPDHGSDSVALETTARRDGDDWIINGEKYWIGHGAIGGLTVVWARMDDGEVGGFLVPQDTPGYTTEPITGKVSVRPIPQVKIMMNDMRVPESCRMPNANSFKDAASVLFATRSGVSWMALGSAMNCYEQARKHALERMQFGRPLAANQLIQQRLTNMLQDITAMALFCRRMAELDASGNIVPQQASLAKLHNTRAARRVAAEARDLLGGSGILLENNVIRQMVDIESMHTFEGTESIQSLIVGKKITGIGAFR